MSSQGLINKHIHFDCIITEKIKNYQRINHVIIVRECPQIYNFIILQSLLTLKVQYHINVFKSDKFLMTLLNQEMIKKHGHKCDNYDKNDLEIIKAKVEYDFI